MNTFEKVDFSISAPPQLSAAARSGLTIEVILLLFDYFATA